MQDTTPIETPAVTEAEADTQAAEAIAQNPKMQEAKDVLDRLIAGDFSVDTWTDLWTAIGWPIAQAIVLIIAVFVVSGWASKLVVRALRKTKMEETLTRFFGNLARWAVMLLGGLAVLSTFGVDTTSFAAVIAALGFAVGMAMSGMLSNFAAGVMLLIFRPFKIGDVVKAAGVFGKIDEIGIFTTSFNTFQNVHIIVPNSKIYGDIIEVVTHNKVRRQDVDLGTSYKADIEETRRVLEEVVANVEGAEQDPAPQVFLSSFGDNSINWQLRVWAHADELWPLRERLIRDAKKALEAADIGIPYPQQDLHVDGPLEVHVVANKG